MSNGGRTIVIGDIHGELGHLDRLLHRLPELGADDTVVFLGDYVDRGPSSRQVIERVEAFRRAFAGTCVTLRGNHEDGWIDCFDKPDPGFLLPAGNGCVETMLSFVDCTGLSDTDRAAKLFDLHAWMPASVIAWMRALPIWYEDEHAIYVHAGLDGKKPDWKSPADSRPQALLWTRNSDFWVTYEGKRLVFGHTPTIILPNDHLNWLQQIFDDKKDIWFRDDLVGVDTACGKGGFLSAVELPSRKIYESR